MRLPQYLNRHHDNDEKSKLRRTNSAFSHAEPVHASVPKELQPQQQQQQQRRPHFRSRKPLKAASGDVEDEEEEEEDGKIKWTDFTQGFKESQKV